MAVEDEFERCVAAIAASAVRTARRAAEPSIELEPPPAIELAPGSPAEDLALALGLTVDEVEFLWSVVARTVEPPVAANARLVFGANGSIGISLAHHIAWRELPGDRSRGLLEILDPRHGLRANGILLPVGEEPFDVLTPWTTSHRICSYLRGSTDVDASVATVGGLVEPRSVRHSPS